MRKFAKKERKRKFIFQNLHFPVMFSFFFLLKFAVYFKRSNNFYVCFIWLCTHSIPRNIKNSGKDYLLEFGKPLVDKVKKLF